MTFRIFSRRKRELNPQRHRHTIAHSRGGTAQRQPKDISVKGGGETLCRFLVPFDCPAHQPIANQQTNDRHFLNIVINLLDR